MDSKDKENKQLAPTEDDENDYAYSTDTVVSSNECTGLIQTPPTSESEAEAYAELYTVPKPVKGEDHGLQREPKKKG